MKKTLILSLCLLFCLSVPAAAAALSMPSAPDVVRPGKSYEFVLETAAEGTVSMTLEDAGGQTYTVMRDYPLQIGENVLRWDGCCRTFRPLPKGTIPFACRWATASPSAPRCAWARPIRC